MSMRTMAAVAVLVVICIAATLLAGEPKRLTIALDAVMDQSQQKKTGVSRLSSEERAALEEWLAWFAISMRGSSVPLGVADVKKATPVAAPPKAARPTGAVPGEPLDKDSDGSGVRRVDLGPIEFTPTTLKERNLVSAGLGQPASSQRETASGGMGYSLTGVGAYARLGEKHWVKEKVDRGAFILLEDGSLWEISPSNRIDTASWVPVDTVVVIGNDSLKYPYKLVSGRNAVEARLIAW